MMHIILISFAFVLSASVEFACGRNIRVGAFGPLQEATGFAFLAVADGIKVAFHQANLEQEGGANGRLLELVVLDGSQNGVNVSTTMDALMASNATALDATAVSPGRGLIDVTVAAGDRYNLTMIAPGGGDRVDYLTYSQNKVLTSPIVDSEVVTMVRDAVLKLQLRRFTVLTTYGREIGNDIIPYVESLITSLGATLVYKFVANHPTRSAAQQSLDAIPLNVQVLINLGSFETATGLFLAPLLNTLPLTTMIYTPGLVFPLTLGLFQQFPTRMGDRRNRCTVYAPLPSDTSFYAAVRFRAGVTAASANTNVSKVVYSLAHFDGNAILGAFAMNGYLIGQMMVSVFRSLGTNAVNAASIRRQIFSRWYIPADDFVYGPFSPPCSSTTARTHCACHSGARQVLMAAFTATGVMVPVEGSGYALPEGTCIAFGDSIQSPLTELVVNYPEGLQTVAGIDSGVLRDAVGALVMGERAGYVNRTTSPSSRTGVLIHENITNATASLQQVGIDRLITLVLAPLVNESVLALGTIPNASVLLDPLSVMPVPYEGFTKNVIHISPTLEQELHTLASQYTSATTPGIVIVSAASSSYSSSPTLLVVNYLASLLERSANTFGYRAEGATSHASIAAGLASLPDRDARLIILHRIQTVSDIAAINTFLDRAPRAKVALFSSELRIWYAQLVAAVTTTANRDRVLFATNLPNWNPSARGAEQTPALQTYFSVLASTSTAPSPQSLTGFLLQKIIASIIERIPGALTGTAFLETLYAVSVIVVDAQTFSVGPFSAEKCPDSSRGGSSAASQVLCASNTGARRITIRTLESVTTSDPARAVSASAFVFSSNVIAYMPLPQPASENMLLVTLVIVASLVAFGLAVAVISTRLLSGRNNRGAPKDASKPFTLMFTDIQSSTSLWAEVPDAMTAAIAHHHELIRALIRRFDGYEVKTIGDAFMIAFKEADDAVRFAFQLQWDFYESQRFPVAVDQTYTALDMEKVSEAGLTLEEVHADPTCGLSNLPALLSASDYAAQWSGLRVRIGIHTAFGEIQKDPVTGGFDYYGTVANTAARVEAVAHGGQVLLSEATLQALRTVSLESRTTYQPGGTSVREPNLVDNLGPIELRGLANPVQLYALQTVPCRAFPPLRLDKGPDPLEDSALGAMAGAVSPDDLASAMSSPSHISSLHAAETASLVDLDRVSEVHHVQLMATLAAVLAPAPAEHRRRELRKMCDLWRIPASHQQPLAPSNNGGRKGQVSKTSSSRPASVIDGVSVHSTAPVNVAAILANNDFVVAGLLEALGRRITPIANKKLSTAVSSSKTA